jgi:hypothetical protein
MVSTKAVLIGLIAILLAIACVTVGVGTILYFNVYNTDLDFATRLSTQYLMNQNDLSEFISGYHEQFGVYEYTLDGIEDYMVDAVKGRYDIRDASGSPTGQLDAQMFVNVIVEAYPQTDGITQIAQRLMDYIQTQRAEFKNNQDKLLDMLRAYDRWRLGMPQTIFLRLMGKPDENLKARIGDKVYTGQDALEKMYQIVLTKEALGAFESGTMEPLRPPKRDR